MPRSKFARKRKKYAFYTLNDTFNKQKMQYITWRYGLHMLIDFFSPCYSIQNESRAEHTWKDGNNEKHTIQFGIQQDEIEENNNNNKTLKYSQ